MTLKIQSSYLSSPSEFISAIDEVSSVTTVLVDFDETLFLRNSTEEYLNCIFPKLLGVVVLKSLDWLQPWNLLPETIRGHQSRDWLRVLISTLLFPWTLLVWRLSAKKLANSYGNGELLKVLSQNSSLNVVIATDGFRFIVQPIAQYLSVSWQQLLACRFWQGGTDRSVGKLSRVMDALGEDGVAKAIAITDSISDTPLLSAVAVPCLCKWSNAKYVSAMTNLYFPLFYVEKVKRPGKSYFLKTVLYDDFVVLGLALSWGTQNPAVHMLGILFLLLSFWCINEVGYQENDFIAEKYEREPVLSNTYHQYKHRESFWLPWFYAGLLAILGIITLKVSYFSLSQETIDVLRKAIVPSMLVKSLGIWMSVLLALRSCYWIYNRVDKQTRVWIYPFLQGFKYFSYLVITSTNLIGAALFATQVIARSLPYFIYRHNQGSWSANLPWEVIRIFLFGLLLFSLSVGSQNFSHVLNIQSLVILGWCLFRARRQLYQIARRVQFVGEEF